MPLCDFCGIFAFAGANERWHGGRVGLRIRLWGNDGTSGALSNVVAISAGWQFNLVVVTNVERHC